MFLAANELPSVFDSYIGASAERRHRVFGVESVSETAENARFVLRYNAAYAPPVTRLFNLSTSYDALYLTAWATFALGSDAAPERRSHRALRAW